MANNDISTSSQNKKSRNDASKRLLELKKKEKTMYSKIVIEKDENNRTVIREYFTKKK